MHIIPTALELDLALVADDQGTADWSWLTVEPTEFFARRPDGTLDAGPAYLPEGGWEVL